MARTIIVLACISFLGYVHCTAATITVNTTATALVLSSLPPGVYFYDDFPNTVLDPNNWTNTIGDPNIDGVGIGEPSPPYSLRLNGYPDGHDGCESRVIDLDGLSNAGLMYWYERTGGGESPESGDDLVIEYWNGSNWIELERQPGDGNDMTEYVESVIDLPPEAMHSQFRLRISSTGTSGNIDDWFVDDILIADQNNLPSIIGLSSSEFAFYANKNGPNPDDQIFTIRNSGVGTLNWEISEACDWLTVDPCSGSSTGEPNDVTISVDISGLAWGNYNCQLTISDPCAMNSPQIVTVILYVRGIIYVKEGASGNGTSWASAFGQLQSALNVAINGDQIWVTGGIYYPTSDYGLSIGDRGKHFQMKNGVAIYGGFPDTGDPNMADRDPNMYETILSGGDTESYHVFYHPDGLALDPSAILDGFTITGGCACGSCISPGPHCSGGGMYNYQSSPAVTNCLFIGNRSSGYWSGANGGGMYNYQSSPAVTNCLFIGNRSSGYYSEANGGGMYNDGGSPTIINCTFSGNTAEAGSGGGMYNMDSNPTVTNCTFSGNRCMYDWDREEGGSGGGICNFNSSTTVTNCAFNGNWAEWQGGGMTSFHSGPTVANCIFWGNTSLFFNEICYFASVIYSCVQGGWSGEGNIDSDPLFADPDGADGIIGTEDDNLRLLTGSPCIDSGDSNSVGSDLTDLDGDGDTNEPIPFDLDGLSRFVDDPCTPDTGAGTPPIVDMGAYERGLCGDTDHPYLEVDINNDCEVNITDAVIMAMAWLSEDGGIGWNPACNLYNLDSIIDASDFAVMGQHWLECTKPECD